MLRGKSTAGFLTLQLCCPLLKAPVFEQTLSIITYNTRALTLYCTLRRLECNWSQSQLEKAAVVDQSQRLGDPADMKNKVSTYTLFVYSRHKEHLPLRCWGPYCKGGFLKILGVGL